MQRIYRYFDQKTLETVAKLDPKLYGWPIHNQYYFTGVTKFKRLKNVRCSTAVTDLSSLKGVHTLHLGDYSKVTVLRPIAGIHTLNLGWYSKVTDL